MIKLKILTTLLAIVLIFGTFAPSLDGKLVAHEVFWDASYLGDGWFFSEWFGYFAGLDHWIYHLPHGYLYCTGNSHEGIWAYDPGEPAWLWTRNDIYPYIYNASDQHWYWYLPGSQNPRWFVDLYDNEWIFD